MIFKIRRGLQQDLPQLEEGELGLTLDTNRLYIGSSEGNIEFENSEEISTTINQAFENLKENVAQSLDETTQVINTGDQRVESTLMERFTSLMTSIQQQFENVSIDSKQQLESTLVDRFKGLVSIFLPRNEADKMLAEKADINHKHKQYLVKDDLTSINTKLKSVGSQLSDVSEKVRTGLDQEKANLNHTHKIGDVKGLQAALDATAGGTLTGLSDVNISSPLDNQSLTYDLATQKWVNETVTGSGITEELAIAYAIAL